MKQLLIFGTILLLLAGCSTKDPAPIVHKFASTCDYYSLQQARCLDEDAFLQSITPYKVVFVGDHHDSMAAHKDVVALIDALSVRGYRVALANEWFTPKENILLEQYAQGELDKNTSKALGWKKRVGYDFNLSEPIFDAVIKHKGHLYGINMSKAFKTLISNQERDAMSTKQRIFYDHLDLNVTAHKQMLSPFFSHCHHHKKGESTEACQARMYRVQVAWDTMMGEESAKLAAQLKEDEKLIVFVGAMHLESKLGVNLRFARKSAIPSITLLPLPRSSKVLEADLGSSDMVYLYTEETQEK